MKREAKYTEPAVRRPTKVELSDKNLKLRAAIVIVAIAIAVAAFGIFAKTCTSKEGGWTEIESDSVEGISYDNELYFFYNLGTGEMSATSEFKLVSNLYNKTLSEIAPLLDAYNSYDGVNNLYTLNRHPNQEFKVSKLLYEALELIGRRDVRNIYCAPVLEAYSGIFSAKDDSQAVLYDPYENEALRAYFSELCAFVSDKQSVDLQLLGDNTVRLYVSEAYLAFAKENGIRNYVDLWLFKNAFMIDHCVKTFTAAGYTNGYFISFDGYMRNMDGKNAYDYDVHTLENGQILTAAILTYDKPISLANFRIYGLGAYEKASRVYVYKDLRFRHDYLDVSDGLCKAASSELIAYSFDKGCAETALLSIKPYIAEELDASALASLTAYGVNTIYVRDKKVVSNGDGITFAAFYDGYAAG